MEDDGGSAVRVFILDGHEASRRDLKELLEGEGVAVVGESGSAAEATSQIPALKPHVAVLDARLPDGTGTRVCRQVRAADHQIRCLILIGDHDEEVLREAVLSGSSGCVLKQPAGQGIAAAVRRAAAGEVLFDPAEEDRILRGAIEGAEPVLLDGMSPREGRVLELLGQGMTYRQIAYEMALAEKTALKCVSSILTKLRLQYRTVETPPAQAERAARTAPGPGSRALHSQRPPRRGGST